MTNYAPESEFPTMASIVSDTNTMVGSNYKSSKSVTDRTYSYSTKHEAYRRAGDELLRLVQMQDLLLNENNENYSPRSSKFSSAAPEVARRDSLYDPSPQKVMRIPEPDKVTDDIVAQTRESRLQKSKKAESWVKQCSDLSKGHKKSEDVAKTIKSKRITSRTTDRVSDEILVDLWDIRDEYKRGLVMESEALRNMGRSRLAQRPFSTQGRLEHLEQPFVSPRYSDHCEVCSHRPISEPLVQDYKYKTANQLQRELLQAQKQLATYPPLKSKYPLLRYYL
ncbi:unnamed protein product [Bursaphelenchus okinawaensis]|uniref:Uncharacterized protein n=1 Tax=Bursaphelenchus okinawaensis TaxID=465554 RepID=A0A811JRE4_9BILA|nr:unnamed protein product [Bursaphelenchus okinawaensis]CAG9079662.1 unnamed protein product [Bursaphelenchus okinawaensis]